MTVNKPSGILETALYVDDLDAADSFYGGILKLDKVGFVENRHIFYRCGEGMLLIFNPAETRFPAEGSISVPPHGTSGAGHMCFSATNEEIDEFRKRFEKARIEIERDLRWLNGAQSLYARDPAGNSIEFAEPSLWDF